MIIDLRESKLDMMEFWITKKQLQMMVKARLYELFGLDKDMGKKRYTDNEYMEALRGTITFEADSLMDIFEDFAKASREKQDMIASFIRYRFLHYFGEQVRTFFGNGFKDMLVAKLLKDAETSLIFDITSKLPQETNKYSLFGRNDRED